MTELKRAVDELCACEYPASIDDVKDDCENVTVEFQDGSTTTLGEMLEVLEDPPETFESSDDLRSTLMYRREASGERTTTTEGQPTTAGNNSPSEAVLRNLWIRVTSSIDCTNGRDGRGSMQGPVITQEIVTEAATTLSGVIRIKENAGGFSHQMNPTKLYV